MKKWPIVLLALAICSPVAGEDKEGLSVGGIASPTAPGQVLGTFDGVLSEWETIAGGSGNCHIIPNGPGSYTLECPGYTGGGGGPPAPGSITDAMLASAYSGVGACPNGEFVNILNRNAAPGCATPAGGPGGGIPEPTVPGSFLRTNLGTWVPGVPVGAVGAITDDMLANAYSGVGTCPNGEFVFTLNRNAPPTCEPWDGGGPAIGPTPPLNPFAGDLWINTSGSAPTLEIYDGAAWVVVSNPTPANTSPTPPLNPLVGEIWYDSSVTPNIMKMWDGSAWVVAGGEWAPVTNPTGGANNYAPLAGPTFSGVPTMGVLQTSSNNVSQILMAPAGSQQGSITSGTTIGVFLTQGARYASGAWTSTNTTSTAIGLQGGNLSIYSDTGIPILSTFTPTLIGRIGPGGTDLPGPLTISGAPVGNFAPLTNPAGGQNNYAPIAGPTFTGTVRFPDNTTATTTGFSFGQRATFGSGATINFGLTSANQSTFQGTATFNSTISAGPINVQTTGATPSITIQSGGNAIQTGQPINAGGYLVNGTAFGGTCPAGEFVNAISAGVIPTCATPTGGGGPWLPVNNPTFTGLMTGPHEMLTTVDGTPDLMMGGTAAAPLSMIRAMTEGGNGEANWFIGGTPTAVSCCTATLPSAEQIAEGNGQIYFSINTGLTIGNTFNPTNVFLISPTSARIFPPLAAIGGMVSGNPTGGNQGAGTINATGYFLNGQPFASGLNWGPWIDESTNGNVPGATWLVRETPDHTNLQMYYVALFGTPIAPGGTAVLGYLGQNNWSFLDNRFDYRTGAYSWMGAANARLGGGQHTPVTVFVASSAPSPPVMEVRNSTTDPINDISFAISIPWGGPSSPQVFPTGTPLKKKK